MRPQPRSRKGHKLATRLYWTQANRAQGVDTLFEPGARARFYLSGTATPVSVYEDSALATELSQPIVADENGLFQPVFASGTSLLRVLMTDADDATLPGYPIDNIVPTAVDVTNANSIPFAPTEALPFTTVQAAIEGAAALSSDQTDLQDRAMTPWATGGSVDAYTITPDPAITGFGTFLPLRVRFTRANTTTTVTLNPNALGARNIYKMQRDGTPAALAIGDIQPGDILDLAYDGTQFVIMGQLTTQGTGYRRSRDGLQICWTTADMVFSSVSAVRYVWSFPVAFAETPVVSLMLPFGLVNYTNIPRDLIPQQDTGTTSVAVYCLIPTGAASLPGTAEVADVRFTAIGRWF
jgi:hypothetical protein